jgi:hypothetical protein
MLRQVFPDLLPEHKVGKLPANASKSMSLRMRELLCAFPECFASMRALSASGQNWISKLYVPARFDRTPKHRHRSSGGERWWRAAAQIS